MKYEGFSKKDATFAVEHLDVSWRKQAVGKAKEYLEYSHISRSGLIDQLKYEGSPNPRRSTGPRKPGSDLLKRGTHARLGLIGVDPAYRRQGLSRALLAHALHPVHERGITAVTAEADDPNVASLGPLRGLGSVESGSAAVLKRSRA